MESKNANDSLVQREDTFNDTFNDSFNCRETGFMGKT